MKYVKKENNKEILYIQNKDINFIINYSYMPKYIKDTIPLEALILSSMDEYRKYADQSIVKWFKDAFYILDSDEVNSMSISEINDKIISNTKKVNDLLEELAILHKKTSYKRELDLDNIKKIYESIKEDIIKSKSYYYNLNDVIDKNIFFSPSMYLLIRNISLIYYLLEYSEKEIDKWYQSIPKEKNVRVCLLHNNISIEHLIVNENKYLINWDKSYFGNPINDIVSFYKKYYQNLGLEEVLKIYENKNKLSNLEKELLLIKLSLPERIVLTKDTFNDTKLINDELSYLTKVYDYVKKSD